MRLDGVRTRLGLSWRVVRAVLRSPALRRVEIAFLLFNAAEFGTWVAILLFAYAATGPASVGHRRARPAPARGDRRAARGEPRRPFPRERVLFAGYVLQAVAYGATRSRCGRTPAAGGLPRRGSGRGVADHHPPDPGRAAPERVPNAERAHGRERAVRHSRRDGPDGRPARRRGHPARGDAERRVRRRDRGLPGGGHPRRTAPRAGERAGRVKDQAATSTRRPGPPRRAPRRGPTVARAGDTRLVVGSSRCAW